MIYRIIWFISGRQPLAASTPLPAANKIGAPKTNLGDRFAVVSNMPAGAPPVAAAPVAAAPAPFAAAPAPFAAAPAPFAPKSAFPSFAAAPTGSTASKPVVPSFSGMNNYISFTKFDSRIFQRFL